MTNVDVVLHETAMVSVPQSVKDPEETHDVNVTGTVNMLEATQEVDARVIVASSAAVVWTS
jgi:UDP-glucose 4-epimerase